MYMVFRIFGDFRTTPGAAYSDSWFQIPEGFNNSVLRKRHISSSPWSLAPNNITQPQDQFPPRGP